MKNKGNWRLMTLEILENHNFCDPVDPPTGMVSRCLELLQDST